MDEMIPTISVNLVTVLAGGIAAFVAGMIWYSPAVYGKKFMKMMGVTQKEMEKGKEKMTGMMVQTFIVGLVTAFVLTHFLAYAGVTTVMDAVVLAFWVWLGFYATSLYLGVLYEKKSMDWWFMSAGHYLFSLLVTAIVLTVL